MTKELISTTQYTMAYDHEVVQLVRVARATLDARNNRSVADSLRKQADEAERAASFSESSLKTTEGDLASAQARVDELALQLPTQDAHAVVLASRESLEFVLQN